MQVLHKSQYASFAYCNMILVIKMYERIKALREDSDLNQKDMAEAGLTMDNVVKTTVFLSSIADFAAMNEIYAQFFTEPYPARSAVAVKDLPKGALVEVEVLAVKPE